jgi:hypothetical protein
MLHPQDPEKLKARADRFGPVKVEQKEAASIPAVGNKKRGAAVVEEEVDVEEQERRRKRAQRFGIPVPVRSKLNCPMISGSLRKFDTGREGLRSFVLYLTILIHVLLPLWILCAVMIGEPERGQCASTYTRPITHLMLPPALNQRSQLSCPIP